MKILFVCTGNICRSPTAEAVLRSMCHNQDCADQFDIDSAGTHAYHVGEPPDSRAQRAARRRGYGMNGIRARQVSRRDFEDFDLVLGMDQGHIRLMRASCPGHLQHKIQLFLSLDQSAVDTDVPDPYYGGPQGFEQNLDVIESAAQALIDRYRTE